MTMDPYSAAFYGGAQNPMMYGWDPQQYAGMWGRRKANFI